MRTNSSNTNIFAPVGQQIVAQATPSQQMYSQSAVPAAPRTAAIRPSHARYHF